VGVVALFVASGVSAAVAAPDDERVAGSVLAQDAGEGGDADGRDNTDVSELWELYPIDPADAGTPLPTPEPAATDASGSVVSPAAGEAEEPMGQDAGAPPEPSEDVPAEGGGAPAGTDNDAPTGGRSNAGLSWLPWLAVGAVTLVVAGGGAAFAVHRSSRPSGDVPSASPVAEPSTIPERSIAAIGPPPRVPARVGPDREHVRIHLHDGRQIEGWKKSGRVSEDNRVIVLDVESVHDSSGRELATTPLDSFVLPPQVDHIESLE
jgi:hypothetical protein